MDHVFFFFFLQFQEVYEDSGAYAAGFPEYQRTSSYDYSGQPIPPRGGFYEPEYSGKKCQRIKCYNCKKKIPFSPATWVTDASI